MAEVARLNRERGALQQQTSTLAQKVMDRLAEVARLNREREALRQTIQQQTSTLAQKAAEVARLNREWEAQQRSLNAIYDSRGWKVLSVYYGWRDKLLPEGSFRRVAAKFLLNPHIAWKGIRLLRDMRLIADSGLFDSDWYLQQNPDVAKAGVNPLRHYLRRGAIEGRDPNPLFDSDWYLQQNPDVARAGVNPLVDYLRSSH